MPPLFFASLDVPYPCHERQKHSGEPSSRLETVWRGFPKLFTPRFATGRAAAGPSHGACMSACPTRHTGPLSGPKHTETKIRIGKSSNKVIVYRKESPDFIPRTGEHNWESGCGGRSEPKLL